jgi:hypothetical protein
MKARRLILGLLASAVSLILLAGCAQPNKQLWYGTWTSPKGPYQKSVHSPDGTVENFVQLYDSTPVERASVQIVKCWLDSSGNTWFNTQGTILEGPHKNSAPKIQTLEKIDKTGMVAEVMVRGVAEFSLKSFPTKIDPTDPYLYMSFGRASK